MSTTIAKRQLPSTVMYKDDYDINNNGIVDTATQVVFEVILQESVTLGDPIYVTTPSPTQIFVGRARQDTPSKMPCIGLALETANGGNTIKAVNIGGVFGMNTNGLTNGQALYVAPTGGYTTTKPSTRVQNIGLVGRVGGGDGIIIASVMNMQDDLTSTKTLTENSAGATSGFNLTNNNNGTVNISSGIALLRSTNSEIGILSEYSIPAVTNLTLVDNTDNFVLVNYNGGTPAITVTTDPSTINTTTNSIIYLISRVGNNLYYVYAGGQNLDANGKLRRRFLNTEAFYHSQGAILSYVNRNLLVTNGLFYSGLLPYLTPSFNTSTSDTFTTVYKDTVSNWTRVLNQTQINNTQYNDEGVLISLGNNDYRSDFIYILVDNPSKIYVVLGEISYPNITQARLAPKPSSLPSELLRLGILIGRVIIQENGASIFEATTAFDTLFIGGTVINHNETAGLNSGDYIHLTLAEKAIFDNLSSLVSTEVDINFGASNKRNSHISLFIADTNITSTSTIKVALLGKATADHSTDEVLLISPTVVGGNNQVGVGFTISAYCAEGTYGIFKVTYSIIY
jgi:hypothetical protein